MIVGIVGNGFVGQATKQLCKNYLIYDICPNKCFPRNLKFEDLKKCDIIFVCVPTPMNNDGSCYTTIVRDVVKKLKRHVNSSNIIIRSTVTPNTCENLGVNFMPEFLTEKNWKDDVYNCNNWILGSKNTNLIQKFKKFILSAYKSNNIKHNKVTILSPTEAEIVKYSRNCFLATKVSFFNELYEICKKLKINFENVRNNIVTDERIGKSHSSVPGPDKKKGFGGTCLPKDLHAFLSFMKQNKIKSYILENVCKRNNEIDRREKDWMKDKRAAI